MKVTVVGAGAVGASCAEYIAIKDFASEVVLLDIKEGYAEGKAMDLMQTASLNHFDTKITGSTSDYSKTANSDIAVITSGIPRKPGMTREELIGINAGIVKDVSSNIIKHSPNVIIIVVSNPMDTMTYLVHKTTDLPKNRIIGMGGALDSARFKYRLAEALEAPISDVDGMVIGGHSDKGMVPLTRLATRNSVLASEFLSEDRLNQVMADDQQKMFPCSAMLEGEYGLNDIAIGVPVILGRNGIEKIVEIELSDAEKAKLKESAEGVSSTNSTLDV